ncbi:ACP S-malonyltransferase [Limosilactobacillus reuteri]|uniref:ACP S-malonyltransferase n=1 Tax=Limosilactobacillus reuteri TaxID=1598 RepID=UPI001E433999|nr:ACP S-malonyltransferase [Limosilactobacillus reuteri]MCC4366607.1 ACP S-malonyltransferase [Limosilactobacillus reuteri]
MYYGILFSGQGAQRSGMGVELMADSLFSRIVSWASDVCELDLLKIMKNEHNELNKTVYVQPAIVTVSYGIYQMLKRDLPQLPIKGMVGLSLGEYAALIASNSLSFEEGIKLVADREISTLAAVLDPQLQEIKELITAQQENGQRVYIANYNSPRQIVVGGALTDLKATLKKMEEDKLAKRTILLKVNGAFHTPFFNGARQQMHNRLQTVDFHEPQIEVISNTTNSLFHCEDLQGILEKQLAIPTHFGANVKELVKHAKIDTTLEIGPGKTLSRFAHQVDQQLNTQHIENLADYETFIKEQKDGTDR